jgi:hypothetical protein
VTNRRQASVKAIANPQSQSPIRNLKRQSAISIANPQSKNRQSSIDIPQSSGMPLAYTMRE